MAASVAAKLALVSAFCGFLPGVAGGNVMDSADGSDSMNSMRSRRSMVRAHVDAVGHVQQVISPEQPVVHGTGSASPILSLLGKISNDRSAPRQKAFASAIQGRGRLGSCAVVGTGRSLLNASLGKEIDAHEWVFRQNQDNSTYKIAADTGMRSDVIVAGHGLWPWYCLPNCWSWEDNRDAVIIGQFDGRANESWWGEYNGTRAPLPDLVPKRIADLNARSAEVKRRPREDYGHDIYALADARLNDLGRRLTLASGAKLNCKRNFTKDGLAENTAGFLSFLVATLVCDEVDVYGFGPDASNQGSYSLAGHGGDYVCNHDYKAEHDIVRSWSATGRCPAHPREYTMPGGPAEERLGHDVVEEIRSAWEPDHDAQDAELLDRACLTSRVTFHE